MSKQYKQIWTGRTARTLELLNEEREPETPLDVLIKEEEQEFDVYHKKHKHLIKEVKNTLKKLTPRQRNLLQLYFIKGKTQKEIGQTFGIARNTVSEIIKVAKRNFKKYYK